MNEKIARFIKKASRYERYGLYQRGEKLVVTFKILLKNKTFLQ
jgi:hypothetical protein